MNEINYTTTIIVPCYNEEKRLNIVEYKKFILSHSYVKLLFVNDGSTDGTGKLLKSFVKSNPSSLKLLELEKRVGKGEAIRNGLLSSLSAKSDYIGYWDADLATPLREIPNLCRILEEDKELMAVFGSRVKLLGRIIDRKPSRHYTGRIFATIVSLILKIGVYDTQCGAKIFRVTKDLKKIFQTPFLSSWIFDVEVIARILEIEKNLNSEEIGKIIYEYPLTEWRDVAGSNLKVKDFIKSIYELFRIYRIYIYNKIK